MWASTADVVASPHHHWRRRCCQLVAAVLVAAVFAPLLVTTSAQPAAAAGAAVVATGHAVYVDDKGNTLGISSATVELCDADPFGCTSMGATSTTDANGYFRITGTGGDEFFDLPDPTVRVYAQSAAGKSMTPGWPQKTYCIQTRTENNADGRTTIALGTVSPDTGSSCYSAGASIASEDAAWQLHNNILQAWSFTRSFSLANPGGTSRQWRSAGPA